jgi:hypothetical protein
MSQNKIIKGANYMMTMNQNQVKPALKFKNGDMVFVKAFIRTPTSEEEYFLLCCGQIVLVDETKEYPYHVEFFQNCIQEINISIGNRQFAENELEFVEDDRNCM